MPKQQSQKPAPPAKPGFFRYLGAIFYDFILVIAIFFVATAILLPFNQGEAIHSSFLFPLYLLTVSFLFYGWFWTHGGQTLGLRAWKIRLVNHEQNDISWKQAFIRYLTACASWLAFGLGIVWRLWQKDSKTWQDLSSRSDIVLLDK
ncbi:MAG: RDD family protein [Gammaproteobacteria bacterium]|nr:RDD family protein [Gammaproteobacteria bacterium]MBT5824765.1 RDD family protein [Gammaproteobacteria bacterium]